MNSKLKEILVNSSIWSIYYVLTNGMIYFAFVLGQRLLWNIKEWSDVCVLSSVILFVIGSLIYLGGLFEIISRK